MAIQMKATNREKELLSNSIVDDRLKIVTLQAALRETAEDLYCGDEYHDEAGRKACRFCTSADKILATLKEET